MPKLLAKPECFGNYRAHSYLDSCSFCSFRRECMEEVNRKIAYRKIVEARHLIEEFIKSRSMKKEAERE